MDDMSRRQSRLISKRLICL